MVSIASKSTRSAKREEAKLHEGWVEHYSFTSEVGNSLSGRIECKPRECRLLLQTYHGFSVFVCVCVRACVRACVYAGHSREHYKNS